MDIVVKGRNVQVPEHYRVHVAEKLARMERYDRKVIRFDVELFHEPNRRQAKSCQRVEITCKGKGPVVRAEACAADFYAALDCAVSKLENRFRKMHDRRKVHHGRRRPESVAAATSGQLPAIPQETVQHTGGNGQVNGQAAGTAVLTAVEETARGAGDATVPQPRIGDMTPDSGQHDDGQDDYEPGRVVRQKQHSGKPISVDQALYEMELVGHDFYLFHDADSGAPSVVYRRRGFHYGVIALVE